MPWTSRRSVAIGPVYVLMLPGDSESLLFVTVMMFTVA
jgi:hypothetical protein